jgi:hypothetical protein
MGDKSPKSMRRDKKQKHAAREQAKKEKEGRLQAQPQLPTKDKR